MYINLKSCNVCGSEKTRIFQKNGKTCEKWYRNGEGHKCNRCYMRQYMSKMYARARLAPKEQEEVIPA